MNGGGSVVGQVGDLIASLLEDTGGELIHAPFAEYAENPVGFAREVLGVRNLTIEQVALLIGVRDDREMNVQAGVSVGKTFDGAIVVLWWVYAVGGMAITTAPRDSQVLLIWGNIKDLHDRNKWRLPGECLTKSIKIGGRRRAYGYVASPHAKESFGGRHDPYLLAIIDEASGVSQIAEDGIVANLTDYTNRLLRIGNPLAAGTPYHNACQRKSLKIPIWTHPNVEWAYENGELRPEVAAEILKPNGTLRERRQWPEEYRRLASSIPGGPSVEWIEDKRADRSRTKGSGYWTARLDAEFPEDIEGALVPRAWFDMAVERWHDQEAHYQALARKAPLILGVDVADGVDLHAFVGVRWPVIVSARSMRTKGDHQDLVRARREVKRMLTREGVDRAYLDKTGIGSGVYQDLTVEDLLPVYPVVPGGSAVDKELFVNERAERFWKIRMAFQNEEMAIMNALNAPLSPDLEALREELAHITYYRDSKGRIGIDKKEVIKPRLGRSPNLADALSYAHDGPRPEDDPNWATEEIIDGGFFA